MNAFTAWKNSLILMAPMGGFIGSSFSRKRHIINIDNNVLTNWSYTPDELFNNHREDHFNTVAKGMASGFILPVLPYWAYQEYIRNINLKTLDHKQLLMDHQIHIINRLLKQMPDIDHLERQKEI